MAVAIHPRDPPTVRNVAFLLESDTPRAVHPRQTMNPSRHPLDGGAEPRSPRDAHATPPLAHWPHLEARTPWKPRAKENDMSVTLFIRHPVGNDSLRQSGGRR